MCKYIKGSIQVRTLSNIDIMVLPYLFRLAISILFIATISASPLSSHPDHSDLETELEHDMAMLKLLGDAPEARINVEIPSRRYLYGRKMEAKENKKENEAVIEDEIKKRRIIELLSDNDASDGRRSIIIDDSVLKDALEDAIELQEAKRRAAYSEFSEKADDNGINDLTITSLAEVPPLRRHILIDGSNLDIEDAIEIQEASRRADDSETLEEIDDTNDKRNLIVDNFIPRRRSVLNPLLVTAVGSGLIGLGSGFWGSNMWKELKERWVKEKKENENNESVSGDAPPGGGGSGFDATKDVPTAEVQPVASATRRLYYLDE